MYKLVAIVITLLILGMRIEERNLVQTAGGRPELQEVIIYDIHEKEIQRINLTGHDGKATIAIVYLANYEFFVEVRGKNIENTVDRGGFITLSAKGAYPDGTGAGMPELQFSRTSVVSHREEIFSPGNKIALNSEYWSSLKSAENSVDVIYPVAEIWVKPWNKNDTHYMRLKVLSPIREPGSQVELSVRMSLFAYKSFNPQSDWENYRGVIDPQGACDPSSLQDGCDQQDFPVWSVKVILGMLPTPTPNSKPVPEPTTPVPMLTTRIANSEMDRLELATPSPVPTPSPPWFVDHRNPLFITVVGAIVAGIFTIVGALIERAAK